MLCPVAQMMHLPLLVNFVDSEVCSLARSRAVFVGEKKICSPQKAFRWRRVRYRRNAGLSWHECKYYPIIICPVFTVYCYLGTRSNNSGTSCQSTTQHRNLSNWRLTRVVLDRTETTIGNNSGTIYTPMFNTTRLVLETSTVSLLDIRTHSNFSRAALCTCTHALLVMNIKLHYRFIQNENEIVLTDTTAITSH